MYLYISLFHDALYQTINYLLNTGKSFCIVLETWSAGLITSFIQHDS